MKQCTVCKEQLDYSHYHKSKSSNDGYGYRCKQCDKDARAKYRENNKERFAEVSRRKNLKHRYGITLEQYQDKFDKQGRCCAICETTTNKVRGTRRSWNFAVDHCHDTGEVRGILCNACNRALGLFGDSEDIIKKALSYLKEYETH